ncbi:hypothetical protein BO86DRAFT_455241 [Aspergillus japonicus CBS 114.51]|uniref:Uncharacterized protein n=1 Tax=Aspergillus japonicus CBS 114.51 TaxID=1448312 RepID=A0A8T8X5K1_ASPJA|nr:hypothetical protein BO86DRAFT_455241 [Aspergillus japonicus CBS 114.51]RAH83184.1 hypothetical protein BO86DRAFT_455241 [Aspergillus japonicus CBS 114.51]
MDASGRIVRLHPKVQFVAWFGHRHKYAGGQDKLCDRRVVLSAARPATDSTRPELMPVGEKSKAPLLDYMHLCTTSQVQAMHGYWVPYRVPRRRCSPIPPPSHVIWRVSVKLAGCRQDTLRERGAVVQQQEKGETTYAQHLPQPVYRVAAVMCNVTALWSWGRMLLQSVLRSDNGKLDWTG